MIVTLNDLSLLQAARCLIDDPASWTRYHAARDANGRPINPRFDQARCWCLVGSVMAASGTEGFSPGVNDALDRATVKVARSSIYPAAFNDARNTRHTDVLKVLDQAIEDVARLIDERDKEASMRK